VILRMSEPEARAVLRGYDLPVLLWRTGTILNDTHEAMIADNRTLVGKGYAPIVAVAVWERKTDKMVARFNVEIKP